MIFFTPDDGTPGGGTAPDATPATDQAAPPAADQTQSLIGTQDAAPPSTPDASEPWINQDGTFKQNWYQRFPPEQQAPLARFKSVEELAKGHAHAQSLIGKRGIFLPSEKSSPEEITEFRKQLGVPEKPEEYQLKPDDIPDESWNEDLSKPFREIAHKHHVSQAAMKEITAAYSKMEQFRAQNFVASRNADIIRRKTEGTAALKNIWRDQYGANIQKVQHLADNIMHVDRNNPAWENPDMVAGIMRLASKLSEDSLVGSSNGSNGVGILSGKAAALDIINNEDNPLYKPYHDRFHPQHEDAKLSVRHHFKSATK